MLRITQDRTKAAPAMRLEGKLLAPWVEEVRRQCDAYEPKALRLDLSGVSFVDQAGASLLRELQARGVQITACSNYVAELLELENKQ